MNAPSPTPEPREASVIRIPAACVARYASIAAEWLETYQEVDGPAAESGYVVLFGDKACGWTHSVAVVPTAWRPGCIAVDVQVCDRIYLAAGGSYGAGAAEWMPITDAAASAALELTCQRFEAWLEGKWSATSL